MKKITISQKRNYCVCTTQEAACIVKNYLKTKGINISCIEYGLPEIDDRYHIWRVPLCNKEKIRIGEIVINAFTGEINKSKSTNINIILARLALKIHDTRNKANKEITISPLNNTLIHADSAKALDNLPYESINLIFTSPPYYNAKPEYSEYSSYEEYLSFMRTIIKKSHRVLSEGRFFVMNISPVLVRRASRNESSKRLAVPFDMHRIFIEEGFDFIDDIHWVKPEGVGWAFGRGRRFAADRNPLQYKPAPVTEYILVYRKKTNLLIDWNIRNHPDKDAVLNSKIEDGYEKTNIWRINPTRSKHHPATFPFELAEKVIRYYSFENDVILDPFAGSGTTGYAALKLNRRFVLIEMEYNYIKHIISNLGVILKDFKYIDQT